MTKPIIKIGQGIGQGIGEIFNLREDDNQHGDENDQASAAPEADFRMSLEGTLWCRKGKTKGWKRRLIVLKLEHEGIFECYKVSKEGPSQILKDVYSQLHRQASVGSTIRHSGSQTLQLRLGRHTPWIARDIPNDPSTFVIEIPTDNLQVLSSLVYDADQHAFLGSMHTDSFDEVFDGDFNTVGDQTTHSAEMDCSPLDVSDRPNMTLSSKTKLERDFKSAQKKQVPLRLYFNCPRSGNEKALWLRGFSKVDRLGEALDKRNFFGKIAQIGMSTSRIRRDVFADFTRDARQLEIGVLSPSYKPLKNPGMPNIEEHIERREFMVYPTYCYPHVWMTQSELLEECNLPSTAMHDLRIDSMMNNEIGTLRVEVLQCFGLPKLDRNSESDAVCYLVCGSYAFATDVIPNNAHPIWPRKSRRGCIFPVFHGYARLFIGVFDDDIGPRDDVVGRIVIDLSRLRPSSRYDVTIPLRTSAQVYSVRPRGAIRLRFQLDWKSERAALISYLPKSLKIPKASAPDTSTTVMCVDPTAFRNIAITVHGVHLPGKFSYKHFRATMKEVTLSRKMIMQIARSTVKETMTWTHPAISFFVYCSWMHCIWLNSFGLVPAYVMSFLMLHLLRNYARYGIDGPATRGFVPPTWEEMFRAVATDQKRSIRPICMTPRDPAGAFRNPLLANGDEPFSDASNVETHVPWGKRLFRFVGFLEEDRALARMSPNERHFEFPFSNGSIYPPLNVRESMAKKPYKLKENEDSRLAKPPRKERTRSGHKGRVDSDSLDVDGDSAEDDYDMLFETEISGSLDETVDDNFMESGDDSPLIFQNSTVLIRDQDIDFVHDNGGKKFTEDLEDMRENMHRLTWHLFNYKTHIIKNPDALFFGQGKKSARGKDTKRELEKLLSLGAFSSSNIILSRAAPYVAPLLGAALSFLGVFRSAFNVFTWRDPFMSFWVSLFGLIVTIVLFLFPWRLFLLVTGCIVVGPQVRHRVMLLDHLTCLATNHFLSYRTGSTFKYTENDGARTTQ